MTSRIHIFPDHNLLLSENEDYGRDLLRLFRGPLNYDQDESSDESDGMYMNIFIINYTHKLEHDYLILYI